MITITRRFPVINGYARLSDTTNSALNFLTPDDIVVMVPGAEEVEIAGQKFVEFPEIDSEDGYTEDWFRTWFDLD